MTLGKKNDEDDYGMNGRHKGIGSRYSQDQINGRVIEGLRNIEKFNERLEKKLDDHIGSNIKSFKEIDEKINKNIKANEKAFEKRVRPLEDWKLTIGVYLTVVSGAGGFLVYILLWSIQTFA